MGDEQSIAARRSELSGALEREIAKYTGAARLNYFSHQALLGGSLLASGVAAVIGLWPSDIPKQVVGALAAASATLLGASRQLALQQKANLHYRRSTAVRSLKRRLDFELPPVPSAEAIAAVSNAWSALDDDLNKQWEDIRSGPSGA